MTLPETRSRRALGRVRETRPRPRDRRAKLGHKCCVQVAGFLANQTSLSGCQPRTSCPRPLYERTLLPSLATTHAKASERVIADPLAGNVRDGLGILLVSAFPITLTKSVTLTQPGTQGHTSATSLRKQTSKLRVSDTKHGVAHKDVRYRHCAKDGAFGGHPAPQRQELTRHVPTLN